MKFVLSGSFTPVAHLPELAIEADKTGWDMLTLSDHTVNPETLTVPYPYTPDGSRRWPEFTDWPDQIVMRGACATVGSYIPSITNVAAFSSSRSHTNRRSSSAFREREDRIFSSARHSEGIEFAGPCPVEDPATD